METSIKRSPSVINKDLVRRKLLQCATDTRPHLGKRLVSKDRLNEAEAIIEAWIRRTIADAPSKGVTL